MCLVPTVPLPSVCLQVPGTGPAVHIPGPHSLYSAAPSQAWSPSSCASAAITSKSCPAWQRAQLGIQECQHQFRGRRLNCTTIDFHSLAIFRARPDKGTVSGQDRRLGCVCGLGYRRSPHQGASAVNPGSPEKAGHLHTKWARSLAWTQAVTVAATPSQVLLGALSSLEILRS